MDNRENEILKRIETKTNHIETPEGLAPESMEQRLESSSRPHQKKKIYYRLAGVAAACLVLVISGVILAGSYRRNQDKIEQGGSALNDMLAAADNYDEVYKYLQDSSAKDGNSWRLFGNDTAGMVEESAVEDSSSAASSESTEAQAVGSSDYSDTNIREEGVGEADYVKTDGTYLYVRNNSMTDIEIIDTRNTEMKVVGTISLAKTSEIAEFYIQNDRMMILCRNLAETSYNADAADDIIDSSFYMYDTANTQIITYDISNPAKPEELGDLSQSGTYYSSRFVDGYLYVFSQFYPNVTCARDDIVGYIPFVDGDAITESRILLPAGRQGTQYMVITAVAIDAPDKTADSKAVFTYGGQCYVSGENIYIYEVQYKNTLDDNWKYAYNSRTAVRKISYNNGQLEAQAQGTIPGYLDSSFCIDEYDGYLRAVVTVQTDRTTTSAVYVMNDKLETVGKIEGLAEDERVYSARFMGDAGYFVTFRETDPLFSMDLSDPENPQIIGKLKIPGFSEYLHFYGEGLLLGIGMGVDENTQVTDGVKISMFDISDPADIKEIDKYVIKGEYSSDAFYDYKAVVIDAGKNLIGFSTYGTAETYYVFDYDPGEGFTCRLERAVNGTSYSVTRGVYISETFYVIKGNIVEAYSLKTYEKIDDLIL